MRLRGAAEQRQHRPTGALPLVAARLRTPAQERERAQGESRRRLPPRQLQGALQAAGEQQLLAAEPPEAADDLAEGALPGGGEAARPAARRRRQVPRAQEVPASPHHLGRRGDELLLQGEVAPAAARVVRAQPVPESARETRAGGDDAADHDAGLQLVQESTAARPRRRGEGQVSSKRTAGWAGQGAGRADYYVCVCVCV